MARRVLSEEQEAKVVLFYQAGATPKEIAAIFEVPLYTIRRLIRKTGGDDDDIPLRGGCWENVNGIQRWVPSEGAVAE